MIHVADQLFRLRINYQKIGRLRHLSHLEIVRAMERLVRRAQLPYAITQGFSAHMKHAFGPALPVGTGGLDEYLDVWLTDYLPVEDVISRLTSVTVDDLPIIDALYIEPGSPSLQVSHLLSAYELLLDGGSWQAADISQALRDFITKGTLKLVRKGKTKVFELVEYLVGDVQIEDVDDVVRVTLSIKASEKGSIRPEALFDAALVELEGIVILSITRSSLGELSI